MTIKIKTVINKLTNISSKLINKISQFKKQLHIKITECNISVNYKFLKQKMTQKIN